MRIFQADGLDKGATINYTTLDLTPRDSFLRKYLKNEVYAPKTDDTERLKNRNLARFYRNII